MSESNQLAVRAPNAALSLMPTTPEAAFKFAEFLAGASLMPNHLRGKPADCFLILMRSVEWGMNPLAVAEKTSVINGKLMFEGQLVAALVNTRTNLEEPLDYQFEGEGNARTLHVIGKVTGWKTPREIILTHQQATTINKNGQMRLNPDQQMCYIGARLWARRYTPEVLLGVYAPDEWDGLDTPQPEPPPPPTPEQLAAKRAALPVKAKGAAAMKSAGGSSTAETPPPVKEPAKETTSAPTETAPLPSAPAAETKGPAAPTPPADELPAAGASGEAAKADASDPTPPHPQPEGWPLVIEAAVLEASPIGMTLPGEKPGETIKGATIKCVLGGPEVDKLQSLTGGNYAMANPYAIKELSPKCKASPAVARFTIESWESIKKPGTFVPVIRSIQDVETC